MEFVKKYQSYIAIGLAIVGLVALVVLSSDNTATDTNKKDSAKDETSQTEKDAASKEDPKLANVYNYTAQPGDSYTVLARKAVQTYATNEKVKLSSAQIIAAETNLTVDAGSIELNEGQTVAVDKAKVKAAVDAAKKLDAASLAAWEAYVPYVDFDTRAAGQTKA